MPGGQRLRKRLERRRELQYVHCGAVQFAVAARTTDVGAHEAARHDVLRFTYEWQFVSGRLAGSTVDVPVQ